MKQTRSIMGMPVTIHIADSFVGQDDIEEVFRYFVSIDNKFSTYKTQSEISKLNNGLVSKNQLSHDMKLILQLAEDTKKETNEYFNIERDGKIDPSGIVKGWAIYNASEVLKKRGYKNFYIDAGGDIQVVGKNNQQYWTVGIRNPFDPNEIVKVLQIENRGVATSGTYSRGQHIYNPKSPMQKITDVASITVIGPNIFDADRFATAAFAMGMQGASFIEQLPDFEAYMILNNKNALFTKGFSKYIK